MPELPDVAGFKAYFDRYALNRRITEVRVSKPRILEEITERQLKEKLEGRKFTDSRRHGKLLFAATEKEGGWMVMHFGMTGYLLSCNSDEEKPKHAAVIFSLPENKCFAYVSQRLLGKISWTDDLREYIRRAELGPDALADELSPEKLGELLSKRRGGLKSALMNQSILAGIGNEWSDEILFHCGLNPRVKVDELSHRQLVEVAQTGRSILQTGVDVNCSGRQLPEEYLGRHRHGDRQCPRCRGELAKIKAAGRGSLYCPKCQE